jgi:hypothetical protein
VFVVVEQKEPHAGRMAFAAVEQPTTLAERLALACRIRDELEVPLPIFVDGMDDASRALFSDLPSPAFVIDREGRIADKLPWADAESLGPSLAALLARDAKASAGTGRLVERMRRAAKARRDHGVQRIVIWAAFVIAAGPVGGICRPCRCTLAPSSATLSGIGHA